MVITLKLEQVFLKFLTDSRSRLPKRHQSTSIEAISGGTFEEALVFLFLNSGLGSAGLFWLDDTLECWFVGGSERGIGKPFVGLYLYCFGYFTFAELCLFLVPLSIVFSCFFLVAPCLFTRCRFAASSRRGITHTPFG